MTTSASANSPAHTAATPIDPSARPSLLAPSLLLAFLTLAFLAPFLSKAFHIDDPLFIWAAHQIQQHPGDPYGFKVNWYNHLDEMSAVTQNPPLACYYLAGAASLLGWSEPALHAAFLLPAIGAMLGTYHLARRLSTQLMFAALATLVCPVFLISSSSVMCDTLMLCFWVWALVCWLAALDSSPRVPHGIPGSPKSAMWNPLLSPVCLSLLAGLFITAAALTKYFGMSLIPLLLVHALTRRRPRFLLTLLIPIAALTAYHFWTRNLYGHSLLSQPAAYAWSTRDTLNQRPLPLILLNLLAFTGGCLIPALFLFPFLAGRWLRLTGLLTFLLVLSILLIMRPDSVMALQHGNPFNHQAVIFNVRLAVQLALFAVGGLAVLLLTIQDLNQYRDPEALLLALWILGTMFFTGFVNWAVNGRSILPMAPAVAIILARAWTRRKSAPLPPPGAGEGGVYSRRVRAWRTGRVQIPAPLSGEITPPSHLHALTRPEYRPPSPGGRGAEWPGRYIAPLALSATVALAATWADTSVADANRAAADYIVNAYGHAAPHLWFEGHWGFQYYAQRGHAQPLTLDHAQVDPPDVIAMPLNNSYLHPLNESNLRLLAKFEEPVFGWTSVHSGYCGAGFYADMYGSAPFVFGPTPPERFRVWVVTKPVRGSLIDPTPRSNEPPAHSSRLGPNMSPSM